MKLKTFKNFIFLVFIVYITSCATQQKQIHVETNKSKSELILGKWKCQDKLKIGELNMHFLFNESYHHNGDYESSGTLRADFQLGEKVFAFRLRSRGFWYFSEGNRLNYKINHYSLEALSEKYSDTSMNPKDYIPKSKNYQTMLLKLTETELQTKAPMFVSPTKCHRT